MPKNNIIPQMFDVRPVKKTGDLDWDKIKRVEENYPERRKKVAVPAPRQPKIFVLGQKIDSHELPVFSAPAEVGFAYEEEKREEESRPEKREVVERIIESRAYVPQKLRTRKRTGLGMAKMITAFFRKAGGGLRLFMNFLLWPFFAARALFRFQHKIIKGLFRSFRRAGKNVAAALSSAIDSVDEFFDTLFPERGGFSFDRSRNFRSFSAAAMLVIIVIGSASFWNKGLFVKGRVLGVSYEGYEMINRAIAGLKDQNFDQSAADFKSANLKFSEASSELDKIGNILIGSSRYFPFVSQLSSGKNAAEAAKHLALAGEDLVKTAKIANSLKETGNIGEVSLLDFLGTAEENLKRAAENLKKAEEKIAKVDVDDLPDEKKEKFVLLKSNLPSAILAADTFLENGRILRDLLGGNGPRKYLFLFQNNQEMRATGGFIGSYGLLDISNGRIRNFFIDGIFNPDGQLKEKVVPPLPIQKISAAWSLHDSNWFPDFPASAKEAIVFYEKTGGPTADGVITLTPTVMEKLLEITGPIEMEEYGVTLDAENFVQATQYEVEVDYDKEENRPKKILSDLAPKILDRLFSNKDLGVILETMDVLVEALNQKHILIYSQNDELQKMISNEGWSGEIRPSQGDYVSVINTNINGFKTDGVIDEEISHEAEIRPDGTIIDTLTITRRHNGGNTGLEWWDKVNADYMRVYVPQGSKFLSVEGQTREVNESPLDYEALGFRKNANIEREESGMRIDEASGTKIYDDFGKTVFANWTYVSPKETMTIKYRYELPFKFNFENEEDGFQTYSLLAQKQAGSLGSKFSSRLIFPRKLKIAWRSPDDLQIGENELGWEADLARDRFWGAIFTEKNLIINE